MLTEELEASFRTSRNNKAPVTDGVHNKMIKIEICLMIDLFWDTWRLIGRSKVYQEEWKFRLSTLIYKKGDRREPKN